MWRPERKRMREREGEENTNGRERKTERYR